jgi:dTDP-L-rhamnose 4-epimerase
LAVDEHRASRILSAGAAIVGRDQAIDRRFGFPLEMVLSAAAAGWRLAEVEVAYLPRIGKSKVTGTVRGSVRTVRDMSRVLAR